MVAVRGIQTWLLGGLLSCLPVATATAQVDLESVKLVKGVDRNDGAIPPLGQGELPYFFEICASGSGFDLFRVRRLDPLLLLGYFEPPECAEDRLPDLIALDEAVPNGDYEITLLQQGVPADSITVTWDAEQPSGFADVEFPADGADDVNPSADLEVRWAIDTAGCPAAAVAECADGLQLFLVDPQLEADVSENFDIPIEATAWTIEAGVLQPETAYDLELETVRGVFDAADATVGGDPVLVTAVAKDINNTSFTTTVPEPGAVAAGLAALATAGLLARCCQGRASG